MSRARWTWLAAAALILALGGGGVRYMRARPAAPPPPQRDPGLALLLAIRTLERGPQTRLTKEQIAQALPFIKALKDVPPSDAEAAAIIARAVRQTFTPAQRTALEEARKRFQERVRAQGGLAAGGAGGAGPGGEGGPPAGGLGGPGGAGAVSEEQRAQARTRAFERMIRHLERRIRE